MAVRVEPRTLRGVVRVRTLSFIEFSNEVNNAVGAFIIGYLLPQLSQVVPFMLLKEGSVTNRQWKNPKKRLHFFIDLLRSGGDIRTDDKVNAYMCPSTRYLPFNGPEIEEMESIPIDRRAFAPRFQGSDLF